jgi:hypothetical protein
MLFERLKIGINQIVSKRIFKRFTGDKSKVIIDVDSKRKSTIEKEIPSILPPDDFIYNYKPMSITEEDTFSTVKH